MIATALTDSPAVPVRHLCTLFGVSRAWYYARAMG